MIIGPCSKTKGYQSSSSAVFEMSQKDKKLCYIVGLPEELPLSFAECAKKTRETLPTWTQCFWNDGTPEVPYQRREGALPVQQGPAPAFERVETKASLRPKCKGDQVRSHSTSAGNPFILGSERNPDAGIRNKNIFRTKPMLHKFCGKRLRESMRSSLSWTLLAGKEKVMCTNHLFSTWLSQRRRDCDGIWNRGDLGSNKMTWWK